jgi:transglutaminase-like putative cysteine protease
MYTLETSATSCFSNTVLPTAELPTPRLEQSATPKTRRLRVVHRNTFQYDRPVERSVQKVHLKPFSNAKQRLLTHSLEISPAAPVIAYDDVFGNATVRAEIVGPYQELNITAESVVELVDDNPFASPFQSPGCRGS